MAKTPKKNISQSQMVKDSRNFHSFWQNRRIGITGATGTLGKALTKQLREKGAVVIGFTHSQIPEKGDSKEEPHEWIQWKCGEEKSIDSILSRIDILILNHGINPKGRQESKDINEALEINALSTWKLFELFEIPIVN